MERRTARLFSLLLCKHRYYVQAFMCANLSRFVRVVSNVPAPHDVPSLPPCLSGVAFLTATASASIFPLACSGGGSCGAVDPFAAQAKPLLWKGKALSKALPLCFLPLLRSVASR
ncbi:unnamed protein product [Closterium sp. NIES-54]